MTLDENRGSGPVAERHRVDADTLAISYIQQNTFKADAQLVGAMHANRINILSTREGAGINMGISGVEARQGIDIASQGNLNIASTALRAAGLPSTLD